MKPKTKINPVSEELVLREEFALAARELGFSSLSNDANSAPASSEAPAIRKTAAPVRRERFVLRRERKGRKGKTVTLVETAGFSSSEIASLAQELRRSLGCGSSVDERDIVLQGDMVDRCKELLQRKGISFVVSGG